MSTILSSAPNAKASSGSIKNLQSKGVRVDGIGIQGHWFLDFPRIEEIETYVLALSQLGVKLMITEMDVSALPFYPVDAQAVDIPPLMRKRRRSTILIPNGLPDSAQKALAKRYADLFSLFRKHRDKFSRVTFWAVHDGQSWRNYLPITRPDRLSDVVRPSLPAQAGLRRRHQSGTKEKLKEKS